MRLSEYAPPCPIGTVIACCPELPERERMAYLWTSEQNERAIWHQTGSTPTCLYAVAVYAMMRVLTRNQTAIRNFQSYWLQRDGLPTTNRLYWLVGLKWHIKHLNERTGCHVAGSCL